MNDTTDTTNRITVEEIRKLALPLGTRVVAGDGLLHRAVTWTTVIYPEGVASTKALQPSKMILVAPHEGGSQRTVTDVDLVRWAFDTQAAAVVLSENASPSAISEAKAYGIPVLTLPSGSHIRLVEKAIVSL